MQSDEAVADQNAFPEAALDGDEVATACQRPRGG